MAALPEEEWPSEGQYRFASHPNQEARTNLFMCGVRLLAGKSLITPAAITNRKELDRLVTGARDFAVLRNGGQAPPHTSQRGT